MATNNDDKHEIDEDATDPGFVIGDSPVHLQPRVAKPTVKHTPKPDCFLEQNMRIVTSRFITQPIVEQGKLTGKWNVLRTRNWEQYRFTNDVPWEKTVDSREEAYRWVAAENGSAHRTDEQSNPKPHERLEP
ncbi:hypothetical protein [Rubinisphaera italica]|uniref:Uncharacterized protein n=1 Tax=Rubinisphaera italica TaxID=2527969 RepID=A0A5C5XPT6_9PLAN|nr:hypothetical protein [Rubinisphaera italica]TWT64413.1 hypothetical protein Pan54_51750 [Rubinisphaera italica]